MNMTREPMRRVLLMVLALMAAGMLAAPASAGTEPPVDQKDACKNGGWQALTSDGLTPFRNQGECVRHVARGLPPLPEAWISISPLFADPLCHLTFIANDVPAGDYDVTLVNAAGIASDLGPITIEDRTQFITVYTFFPEPAAPGSLTLSRPGFSLGVDFFHTC